jgi:acetyltransferase-like isoleucine patch superfamily enzyme
MSHTSHIYPNVSIGSGCNLGDFTIIGEPPRGKAAGELHTVIGAGAIIRSHTVVYAGNRIGDRFETGHGVLVREENQIGHEVSIGSHTVVEHHVVIGDSVRIHSNTFIPEYSVLETECWIGPGVIFTNARYPRSPKTKALLRGPVIKAGAKIGAGAVLLPGVTVGQDALVGAGAVVVSNVPERAVVVGNPARVIKLIHEIAAYTDR